MEISKIKYKQSSQLYAERLEQQINETEIKPDKLVDSFLNGIIEKLIYLKKKDEFVILRFSGNFAGFHYQQTC